MDPPRARDGTAPALAPGGLVLQEEDTLRLIPLEAESPPRQLDAQRVPSRGLARTDDGWVALTATRDGTALAILSDGEPRQVALGPGALIDGALAVHDGHAMAAWLDDARTLRFARIDLQRVQATEPSVLETRVPRGSPIIEATGESAFVSWRAIDAPLIEVRDGIATRRSAPGLPLALSTTPSGELAVLHRARDRTGLWLTLGERAAVRASHADVQPWRPALAPLPDGLLLTYRAGPDVFVQRLDADGAPAGSPEVVGATEASARGPLVATRGRRFWVAWETRGEPDAVHVRAGRCP